MLKSTTVEAPTTAPDDERYRIEADFLARVLAHPSVPEEHTNYLMDILIDI